MQYYASIDSNNNLAFYCDVIHGSKIPAGAIPITESLWQDAIANHGKYSIQNNQFVAASVWPPVPTAAQLQQQQFATINSTYTAKLKGILAAIQQAQAMSNTTAVTALNTTFSSTQAAWKAALQAIITPTKTAG